MTIGEVGNELKVFTATVLFVIQLGFHSQIAIIEDFSLASTIAISRRRGVFFWNPSLTVISERFFLSFYPRRQTEQCENNFKAVGKKNDCRVSPSFLWRREKRFFLFCFISTTCQLSCKVGGVFYETPDDRSIAINITIVN